MAGADEAHHADGPQLEPDTAETAGLDPRRLLIFRQVGRHGSFAAAARALGWTQPAVSQHIHRLEDDLGLPLFTRAGRGVALTEPGKALLQHADTVATALRSADRAMLELAGLRSGRVRIAAFPSASATLVAGAMRSLGAVHPGVELRLTQLEPPEAEAQLLAGDCDIALVFDYEEDSVAARSDVETVPLGPDAIQVVLPPDHPLHAERSVRLEQLRDERWVSGCPRCRQHLVTTSAAAGFAPDIRHSTDDYVVVQALVAAGLAVAVLPALALAASRNPAVAVSPLADHAPRQVRALTARGARANPAIGATLQHLARAASVDPGPGAALEFAGVEDRAIFTTG